MAKLKQLGLFGGFGIELEYMIVDADSLSVKPCADQLLQVIGGGYDQEVDRGAALWSNELALHVIEMKTRGPAAQLGGLAEMFAEQVRDALELLTPINARLLPTGMHPWMAPERELALWPHEDRAIYETFDRIFGCHGHGFANLQSMHVNLPFAGDEEFGRLHAAIRLVLPLIPGLAASSPLVEGRLTGKLDNRLDVYRTNCARIPSVTGHVVPESVFTMESYQQQILEPIYRELSELDPEGVLAHEWVNARGAIARFERGAIEIRTIDLQECPLADLAVAELVVAAVRALVDEQFADTSAQRSFMTEQLAAYHQQSVESGGAADWPRSDYLKIFGIDASELSVAEVWQRLAGRLLKGDERTRERDRALTILLEQGTLARRIVRALTPSETRSRQQRVYEALADCLAQGRLFQPDEV